MAYLPAGLSAEQETTLVTNVTNIIAQQKKMERNRQITVAFAAAGALFAAVRLGIIWAPKLRRRRSAL